MEDARQFLTPKGIDVDAIAPQVKENLSARSCAQKSRSQKHSRAARLLRPGMLQPRETRYEGAAMKNALQRAFSVHRQFGALDHGRGDFESQRPADVHRIQRGQPSCGARARRSAKQIESAHMPVEGLHSKSWDEFAAPGAPQMDFVFTVCDNAAREACPLWPGQPMTAHWGVPDPASVQGTPEQIERAFREAFLMLDRRISLFLALPLASLDALAIKKEIASGDRVGASNESLTQRAALRRNSWERSSWSPQ